MEHALLFEKKKNELLTKTKQNLQFENEKFQQDMIYLEGQNKVLKEENDHLKKTLFSHEKKSIDELKQYQDRMLELMQHINDMKQEFLMLKDSHEINEDFMFRHFETNERVLDLLKSQEMNIYALQRNIASTISPTNQSILTNLAQLNKEMVEIELNLINSKTEPL